MSSLNTNERAQVHPAWAGAAPSDASRRRFLQLMGSSLALASVSSCRWEGEEIRPFVHRPEGRIPGTTRRFATALECGGVASALLVTSYDGRPIKIEGNPQHALDAGACTARSQASVLDLYDPEHSGGLVQVHERVSYPRTWKEFDPWFAGRMARLRETRGQGLCVLAEPSSSLTLAALRARWSAMFPLARWVEWEPLARTQELAGSKLAFGRPLRAHLRLREARSVVCLDSDLLGEHPAAVAHARELVQRRDPAQGQFLRLWSIESAPSLTGAAADHRLALRAEQILPFAMALERELVARLGAGSDAALAAPVTIGNGGFLAQPHVARLLKALADELAQLRGESVVSVGPRQPAIVHALAQRINARLGNEGRALVHTAEPSAASGAEIVDPAHELGELTRTMEAGAVECLLVLGGNPVFDAPADVDFRRALRRVPLSLHLSPYRDETSRACTWHLPRAHALESWGDALSWDGTRCTTQPLIDPIYERRTPIELVASMLGDPTPARTLVRAALAPSMSDAQWKRVLHDGFVADSALAAETPVLQRFDVPAPEARALRESLENGALELVFCADPKVHDGRSANNAWLQELPDALTKMTWGNAAFFSAATAAALGVEDGTRVVLRVGGRELDVGATIVPGQPDGSVSLRVGYGRTAAGVVGGLVEEGVEPVGADAYRLRTSSAPWVASGLTVEATGRKHELARTTDPDVTDAIGQRGRDERLAEFLRETPLARLHEARAKLGEADKRGEAHEAHESLYAVRDLSAGHADVRWGMVIDLNACIGCNACVVACQAENNVPVVGREQVVRGREMHWIRIDRYHLDGERGETRVRFQPLTCQHCEKAPCEQVCPVAATVHSAEGLNDMVYNRCVGTRYCANNCPIKVRRFNFFNYHKDVEKEGSEVRRLLHNPEVTLRSRGVMEKCTFCVQRIQAAKIQAKNAGRAPRDGEVVTACAQTCPTQAIVFGDLADPKSRVARAAGDERAYTMLDELAIRPRTSYLTRITNPNPAAGPA